MGLHFSREKGGAVKLVLGEVTASKIISSGGNLGRLLPFPVGLDHLLQVQYITNYKTVYAIQNIFHTIIDHMLHVQHILLYILQ